MEESPNAAFIKEEDRSDNESGGDGEKETGLVDGIVNKQETSDDERDETITYNDGSIKEEDDDGEGREMEIVTVILPEDDGNFENEGGNIEENVRKVRKVQRPGPRSRKRKLSDSSQDLDWTPETEGNKSSKTQGKWRLVETDRMQSQRAASSSRSLLATATSDFDDNAQVFARPPGRPIPQIYRDTEITEPDNFLHCDECAGDYEGDCPEHGPLLIVEDTSVPADINDKARASKTAPPQVVVGESKIPGTGCGVRAREIIPTRTRFGPYDGSIIPVEECTSYSWLMRKDGEPDHCIDATEPGLSNWMRFINCARNEVERNLVAFQYQGSIYYRTVCQVNPDDELLVWCGKEYGEQLGIHLDASDVVTAKNIKEKTCKCQACSGKLSSFLYFENHKKRYHLQTNTNSSKESTHDADELDETVASSVFISKTDIAVEFIDENELASISTPDESPFVCNQCNEYCFDEETLTSHLFTHAGENPFVCNLCNERFFDRKTLTNHQKAHGVQERSMYVCSECFQSFANKDEYNKHERLHNREKPFKCLKCNKRFVSCDELKGHLQFHDGEKPFGCDQCNKRFHQKHQLQKHLSAHVEEKPPFICPGCQKSFSQKFNLEQHLLAHGECSRRAFTCSLCGFQCGEESDLHSHMEVEHNGNRPFECLSCNERFYDKGSLSRHERTHAGEIPFQCTICNRRFLRIKDMKLHERTHRYVDPEPCLRCHEQFSSRQEYDAHLSTCQLKETFPCPVCGKHFLNRPYLRVHLSLHSRDRHVCPECSVEFTSNGGLRRHMNTHNTDRPFACNECIKQFKTNAELKVHMHVHTGGKPHLCTVCNRRFKFKISFSKHLRTHGLEYKDPQEEIEEILIPN